MTKRGGAGETPERGDTILLTTELEYSGGEEGGGCDVKKRFLRKPGRNWSIQVQVMPHSFVESTAWKEKKRGIKEPA